MNWYVKMAEERNSRPRLPEVLKPVQEQLGLSSFLAFLAIAEAPGMSVNELAEAISVPQSSASRYVSILLGRYQQPDAPLPLPLISQEISAEDPRRRALFVTPVGRGLFDDLADTIAFLKVRA